MNDFKDGDKVWANNKPAIVLSTYPSLFGKEYLLGFEDGTSQRVQPWGVISIEKAMEMGLSQPAPEKAKKDLGDFVEGRYLPDQFTLAGFADKCSNFANCAILKTLDEVSVLAVAALVQGGFDFYDNGYYKEKSLMGGWTGGVSKEYDLEKKKFTLKNPQSKSGVSDVKLVWEKPYVVQSIDIPQIDELKIYYKREEK